MIIYSAHFLIDKPKSLYLSTLEKLLQPIRTLKGNYVVTSYTHPAYRGKMLQLLRHQNQSSKFLIVRGVEGSMQLALDRRTPYIIGDKFGHQEGFFVPFLLRFCSVFFFCFAIFQFVRFVLSKSALAVEQRQRLLGLPPVSAVSRHQPPSLCVPPR